MWAEPWRIQFDKLPYRFDLECLADWQLGSRSCCKWKIEQHIDDILERAKTTDSGILMAGDIEDDDRPSTRIIRAKIAAERGEVVERDAEKHVAWLEKDVIPLLLKLHKGTKYGIMGGVAGHHFTQIASGSNSVQYMFRRLAEITGKPCVYLGEMVSFIDLTFDGAKSYYGKSIRLTGLLQHGEGGGQTKGATVSKLERSAQSFDADFYIRGHDCQLIGTKTEQLFSKIGIGKPGIISCRTKAMLNLGSATMGYEMRRDSPSYIEAGMMRPATMGWGTLKFRVRRSLTVEDENKALRADIKLEF